LELLKAIAAANSEALSAIERDKTKMRKIHKKLVVDEEGNPVEVIIPWEEFQDIEEALGLDLDTTAIEDLEQARRDREIGKSDAFLELDEL
jgi:PHD/YefM family antitoxin component YafN of YafNO toxin-antitoxin module